MLVKKYRSELVSIVNPFSGIYTLEFLSLNGQFKYQPGQFLHLSLDGDYDGVGQWPESRCFSMQSNSEESTIRITYAVKGRFTKCMEEYMTKGANVWLKMPYGNLFSQHHNKTKTVFIAGGTGVTPFLSLFTHNSFNTYINPQIYLGFRSTEFNIYQKDLEKIKSGIIRIFYENLDGQLNIQKIFGENGPSSYYFISGPPGMISAFKNKLNENGVPSQNILTDDWE